MRYWGGAIWRGVISAWAAYALSGPGGFAAGASEARRGVQLLSRSWVLKFPEPAHSSLTAQTPRAEFVAPTDADRGFTARLTVKLGDLPKDKTILEIPDVLRVRLRQHDPLDRNRQNYPAFKMADGSVPVLEASLALHSVEHPDWTNMTLGVPLAMLPNPGGQHELVVSFSGADWKMYVDGQMLDSDFPFGYPRWKEGAGWRLDPDYVEEAALYFPAVKPEGRGGSAAERGAGIQYWVPPGHNNWVGDVETFFHRGRYHVFYLYDRRHHQSKFGCGAHYFEHLSTTDFKTWTEHEASTPLEEQWECIGTGVPFVWKDQLCLAYGLHTTRVYPQEKTTLPAQWAYLKEKGRTGSFQRSSTPGVPAGSTYAVSRDGVANFQKSGIMFHPCENPSVYTDPSGRLRLLANYRSSGMWESDSVDGGWRCVNSTFPPGGDCTVFFRWGRFDYIIGGFTGLWSKPAEAPDSAYRDVVREGLDFYDGLNVPAVTGIGNGRFLMAGWIPIRGWGGPLVIRELVQFPDGRIGSKWMKEVTPQTGKLRTLARNIGNTAEPAVLSASDEAFMLSFEARPAKPSSGRFGISFLPEEGEKDGCELQVVLDELRAQFGPGLLNRFAPREKSLREGGAPHQAGNYAIEHLLGVDKPFRVRVVVKNDQKLGGALIDVEIAGERTMISYRVDLRVRKLVFRVENVELRDVQVGVL